MTSVTLIRRQGNLYPASPEDYTFLKSIGYPAVSLDATFLLLLRAPLQKHKASLVVKKFDDLEEQMLSRVIGKLPGALVRAPSSLDFKVSADYPTQRLDSLALALSAWYIKHFITVTSTVKSTKKTHRLLLTLRDDLNGY